MVSLEAVRELLVSATLCNIDLSAIVMVCHALPESEQKVIEAISGEKFDADTAALQAAKYPGMKWAIRADDTLMPIVVGGFLPCRPGVYRTWFYATSEAWERYGRDVTRLVRQVLHRTLKEHAHRVETVTLADRFHTHRWYETIGLSLESTMPGYGANQEAAVMFVARRQEEP